MYRAVKVVRREDFEYERTFEREFEGIQRYEKVSHDHPGLVDVLHVGRDDAAGHYYYVMELADDEGGEHDEVNVETYKSRTLSSDLRRRPNRSVRECVELGMSMAGALGHLHHAGLTHRDVKPSNIIYVKGQPKLADVGLVASTGQKTFVGTEGYVPPEGPGTSSADLYSLAMVLYEMHTGKDRMEFPELPTNLEIPPTVNRDEWRALNGVICRAGSPDPRKRFESAHSLARALQGVCADFLPASEKRGRPRSALAGSLIALFVLAAAGFGGWWLWQDNQNFLKEHGFALAEGKTEAGSKDNPILPLKSGESSGEAVPVTAPDVKAGEEAGFNLVEMNPDIGSKGGVVIQDEVKTDAASLEETVVETASPEKPKPVLVADPLENQVAQGQVKIMSDPPAATVVYKGEEIGITETKLLDLEVGPVEIIMKLEGYQDFVYRGEVRQGTQVISATLLEDRGPISGNPWMNSIGMEFLPSEGERYISKGAVTIEAFDLFLNETGKEIPRAGDRGIVHVSSDPALWEFCDWMTDRDRQAGYLGADRYYSPRRDLQGSGTTFFCSLDTAFGTLVINSNPPGAKVYLRGVYLGETPTVINDLRLGESELVLFKPGYAMEIAKANLTDTLPQDLFVELKQDASVVFGERWSNSQGMELVPFEHLQVASFETPIRAFREFVTEMGIVVETGLFQEGAINHPATGVSYPEAVSFCEWLTKRERAMNLIRPWQQYRLPTDLEWSRMAGIRGETGTTPEARNRLSGVDFLWGAEWPPPSGSGNFADMAAAVFFGSNIIPGYTDGFERTSPPGSFAPTESGLFDLSGNVWEWVWDPFTDGLDGLQVVRGGGWNSADREVLSSSYRNPVPASAKEEFYGFRYILEDTGIPD